VWGGVGWCGVGWGEVVWGGGGQRTSGQEVTSVRRCNISLSSEVKGWAELN
jgi:hypothetical protein